MSVRSATMIRLTRTTSTWIGLSIIFTVNCVGAMVIVRAPSPKTAKLGKGPVRLECLYRATESDVVLGINWYRKTAYDDNFKLIAQIPNKDITNLPPTFVDGYLASKGNITVEEKGIFRLTTLVITPVECLDEGTYQCEVQVYGGKTPHKPKVQVRLNEDASVSSLKQDKHILVENHPVVFTCVANMGRPVGKFRWIIFRSTPSHKLQEVEMSGSSSFTRHSGSCSPVGRSTLAIIIASTDQKVRCIVQQLMNNEVFHVSEERQLNVQYSVRDTGVYIRVNNENMDLADEMIALEEDLVLFSCVSRGNPQPIYSWSYLPLDGHKSSKGLVNLVEHSELKIDNITTNHSGSYVCVSTNFIRGKEYTETKAVRIIVKDKNHYLSGRLRGAKNSKTHILRYTVIGAILAGAMLFAVLVSLLSVVCYRKCSRNENGRPVRYQGVKA